MDGPTFNPTYPSELPLLDASAPWLADERYTGVLKRASIELAQLKGYCQALPNLRLLLWPAIIKESLASSAIENIHTTVENVLCSQLLAEARREKPDKEVLRYREAILWGQDKVKELTLSTQLILGLADRLTFGKYDQVRTTPNPLIPDMTGQVVYTPPPAGRIQELLGNWERFVANQQDGLDPLIKAAVAHYQFEAIHPLGDGNGRTGRILMVLQLVDAGVPAHPVLYLSGYINANKAEYYALLRGVSEQGAWEAYIRFILAGMEQQARNTKTILLSLMALFREAKAMLRKDFADIYTTELVESLFLSPVLTSVSLAEALKVHRVTASKYLSKLARGGVLASVPLGRNNFYLYRPLLDLLHGS